MFRFYIVMVLISSIASAFEISQNIVIVKSDKSHILDVAANDLSYYLDQITQTKPEILLKIPKNKRAIILTKLPADELKEDGFIIKSMGTNLIIAGANDRGVLFGVFYFLDHYLGCKFLAADYEYISHFMRKELGDINDKQEPRFTYREIFFQEGDDSVFAFKSLLNGHLGHRTVENEADEIYTKAINTHTFISSSLIDEQYECSGQFDFADENVKKYALNSLDEKLSALENNRYKYVMLEHEDRGSFCTNGLNEGERPSKIFLEYTRYLAQSMVHKYPHDMFFYQAYLWSRQAPKKAKKLPENLGVHFAVIEADFSKPLRSNENRTIWDDLMGWGKLTDHVVIWHYSVNFGGYMFPYPNLYALDKDIKDLAALPFVKGLFVQGSYGTAGGDLANLRLWVYAKLLWNPKHNIDDLIGEFCTYYYGAASADIEHYIRKLSEFINSSDDKLFLKTSIDAKYLNSQNLDILDGILSHALAKLELNSEFYNHVSALFAGIDYIRLIRGEHFKNRTVVKNRFKEYLQHNPEITFFAEGVTIENILKIIDLDRTLAPNPKLAEGLKRGEEWFSYQEYQLELCCADIVEDSASSDGVSAVMPGSSNEWGFSLPFVNIPKGKWDIYADVKIELVNKNIIDSTKMALRYGVYPTFVKGIAIAGQFDDGYKSIKIGTIDTTASNAKSVWLSPPGNEFVSKVYVDRIYFIKHHTKF
jgi:hypothetical protein